ncbi:MAG: hypothetical protein PVI30_28140, partial [Myxococcales bacterium]
GAAGTDPAGDPPPRLPAIPDDHRVDDCEACAAEQCADAYANCLEDDHCLEVLRCKGRCGDPPCLRDCDRDHGFSAWFDDFDDCVWNLRCATDCGAGDNWACVGEYAPRSTGEDLLEVELWFDQSLAGRLRPAFDRNDLNFLPGAEVRACEAGSSCEGGGLEDRDNVGPDDRVRLTVPRSFGAWGGGYFEVEQPELGRLGARERLIFPPATGSRVYRTIFMPLNVLPQVEGLRAPDPDIPTLDPDQPRIVLYPRDCLGRPAPGTCFELVGEPDARAVYGLHFPPLLYPEAECEDSTFEPGTATIPNAPEGALRVRGTREGVLTHERDRVYTRAGWTTHVYLDPIPR